MLDATSGQVERSDENQQHNHAAANHDPEREEQGQNARYSIHGGFLDLLVCGIDNRCRCNA